MVRRVLLEVLWVGEHCPEVPVPKLQDELVNVEGVLLPADDLVVRRILVVEDATYATHKGRVTGLGHAIAVRHAIEVRSPTRVRHDGSLAKLHAEDCKRY